MREGVSVHNRHVMNNVHSYLKEFTDDKVSLMLQFFCILWWIVGRVSRRMGIYLLYIMTLMYEGVVAHVQGYEGFSCKVSNTITELVVTSCDEATLFTIQGVIYEKFGVAAITVN